MCLSTGTLLGPLQPLGTFVVSSRVKPIHWLTESTDHTSREEANSYSASKLLNIYDNVPFSFIIKLLCWTLHTATSIFKLYKASKAGSAAAVMYKSGSRVPVTYS